MRRQAALLILLLSPQVMAAQARPLAQGSPIMDMIETAKNALNNLQYAQARSTVREVLALGRIKREQEIAALQVAAAAFFRKTLRRECRIAQPSI